MIKNLIDSHKIQASQKGIIFTHEIDNELPSNIHCDKEKLNQILINLISNAIKFTPANKKINFKVIKDNETIVFMIIDQGIGVAKDKQKIIFEPFRQADGSTTRRFGGIGLGLSIAKKLIELSGGTISMQSQEGVGTSFKITLPLEQTKSSAIEEKDANLENNDFSKKSVVLVVEDEPINQVLMEALFEAIGLKPYFADSGEEGIEKTLELKPNLILMDIHLPGIDGIETTEQIRKNPQFKETPIVALSADAFTEQQQKAKKAGMNDYLTKPIEFDKLVVVLKKYLPAAQVKE